MDCVKLCAQALRLPARKRYLLEILGSLWGEQMIAGRVIVWPSNRHLQERTGIPERTIRHMIGRLTELGILTMRDAPNGKRYARRDGRGRVIDAYGFDLTELFARREEFARRLVEERTAEARRRQLFDRITICRRRIGYLLAEIPADRAERLQERLVEVERATPARRGKASPERAHEAWEAILSEVEVAASGGQGCRHKEHQDESDSGWVRAHCPDIVELMEGVETDTELAEKGHQLRRIMSIGWDSWEKGCARLGETRAARILFSLAQRQCRPGSRPPVRCAEAYLLHLTRKAGKEDRPDEKSQNAKAKVVNPITTHGVLVIST